MEFKIIEPSGKIATMISTDALASLPVDDSGSNLGQTLTLGNNTVSGTYTFDFLTTHPDAKFITQNNLISFKDKYSKDRLYTITRVEDTGTGTATAYCYDYLLVLINSIADSWDYTGDPHPIAFYVDKLIANTGMQIGINEISNLSRALKFDGESDTYLTRLGDVANQFGGAEVDCTVETDGIRVTGVYINIYKHIGKTTLVQDFITGINLDHTERTIDIDRLRTALKAKGGTPEGENQKPITFADIAYDDGQYYTPKGDPVLYDRINGELWSQTRITNSNKIGWIFDNYSYDTLDPQLLLTHTLTKLKSVNKPEVTYNVESVNFDADIGDNVRITDLNYDPPLYLQARVSQVTNHYTAKGLDTGVLANYELLRSEIDPNVKSELDKISKLPGKPGKDGVGITATKITYAQSTSGTTAPSSGWTPSVPTVPAGQFLWTKTVWSYSDSTSETGYSVAMMGAKGDKGDTGASGKDGIPGKDGLGIKSTVIAYQLSSSGTTTPTGTWSTTVPTLTKGQYLWTRTTLTYTDNSSEPIYSVSYVAKDGNNGSNGVAGKDGVGIKTTTITYATSTSGTSAPTSGWTANPPATSAGQYLWTKTVWSYTDGTNETGYSVGKIGEKGEKGDTGVDGRPGKDGVGIKSTTITYALGDSGTATPTTGWTTSVPSLIKGKYLWTKTVWLYTDNTSESGYSTTYIGKDGNNGNDGLAGKDGVGIKSTTITYAVSSSGTTAPTTGWSANPPALPAGQYMWTKNVWTYTDGSTETGYSVGKAGGNGQPSYTHWAWADSADGKTGFSLTASTGKKYIGVYSDTSSTASSDPTKYHWTELVGKYVDELNATIKDIQASIKAIPAFTSGTALPSTGKNGDQFYLTNSSGVVTAYYVYASGWVKHKLDAATLNVGTLSALSANLGTINAGTLNAVKLIGAEFNTSSTFNDPNNAAKKVTTTQLINKDGYKMVTQRNWFDTDIVLETSIGTMGIIRTSYYTKADFDASKAPSSTIIIDPLNNNLTLSNSSASTTLDSSGLYLYDATNSKGVQLKRISGGFQVLASPKTGGGFEDAVLDLKGNTSGVNFHVGDRDDIPYDGQIYVEGRYGSWPATNRSKMHLFGNAVVLHCFDAAEVRGGNGDTDAYHTIRASAFNVSSNPVFKTNIKGYTGGLALVNETDVYRYALKDELKNDKYSDHIGMMLDNVPSEIVGDSEGVDLYSAISVAWSAIKELSAKVEEQDKEIEELKGKTREGE